MLENLRKWASGWVAFVMISLLILSFGIWGISSYITGAVSNRALATVGSKEIMPDEFQRTYSNELDAIARRSGRRISREQARAVGLDSRVLSQLIGSAAIEAHAGDLGLSLSDEAVANGLKSDPSFQDAAGNFDHNILLNVARNLNVSERGLIALRRKDELRNQITTALVRATVVPDEMIQSLSDWRGETRVISYFRIDPDKLEKIPDPTDEDLKKAYDENKQRFMTEPRRELAVLSLTIDELKKKAEFTDEKLKAAFEQTKDKYIVPEKRQLEQISFKDKAAAEKALAEIKSGKDFLEVAKENGVTATDAKLGLKSKKDLIDKKIADAAFNLAKDAVSDVIEGAFTTAIVRVTEIKAGKDATFEDNKDKVKEDLAKEWAIAQLRQYYGKVDDGRGEGKPLKDIATELKLPFHDLKGVTGGNITEDGKMALAGPNARKIIEAGFRGEIGLESEPIQLPDGFAWVDVLNVTDAKQQTFDEVKNAVKTMWLRNKTRDALSELAKKYSKRIKDGEDMAKVAEEAGGKLETTGALGRTTLPDGLTQTAMTQAFAMKPNEISNTTTADGKSRIIFRLDKIEKAPPPSVELKQKLKDELQQQLRTDSIAAYVTALQKRYKVDINQNLFRRITGADQQ